MTTQEAYEAIRLYWTQPGVQLSKRMLPLAGGMGGPTPGCFYRSPEHGGGCAIGCIIPDDIYTPEMDTDVHGEGTAIDTIIDYYPEVEDLFQDVEQQFLIVAQHAHDAGTTKTPEDFVARLDQVARDFDLTVPE